MSGIYIKGMEMPKYGCDHCFLRTGNYCGRIEKDEAVVEYARKNERHPDCPLVPVPEHGRLIDESEILWCVDWYAGRKRYYTTPKNIEHLPTIIPADKEVKE